MVVYDAAIALGTAEVTTRINLGGYNRDKRRMIADVNRFTRDISDRIASELSRATAGLGKEIEAQLLGSTEKALRQIDGLAQRRSQRNRQRRGTRGGSRGGTPEVAAMSLSPREATQQGRMTGENVGRGVSDGLRASQPIIASSFRSILSGILVADAIKFGLSKSVQAAMGSLPGEIAQIGGRLFSGGGALTEAIQIQQETNVAVSSLSALTNLDIGGAADQITRLNENLAKSAAALPGATQEYKRLASVLSDNVLAAFKDIDGNLDTDRFVESLSSISESYGALTASSTRDIGNTSLSLTRALGGASESQLRQFAFFEQNPVALNQIGQRLAEVGAESLGDLTLESRVNLLIEVGDTLLTDDAKALAENSVDGLIESFRSRLFDSETGIFGVRRDLETEIEGVQSVFTSFNEVLRGLVGQSEDDMGLIFRFFDSAQRAGLDIGEPLQRQKVVLDAIAEAIERAKGNTDAFFEAPVGQALITTMNGVRDLFVNIGQDSGALKLSVTALATAFTGPLGGAIAFTATNAERALPLVNQLGGSLMGLFQDAVPVATAFGEKVLSLAERIVPVVESAIASVRSAISGAGTGIEIDLPEFGGNIREASQKLSPLLGNVREIIGNVVEGIGHIINGAKGLAPSIQPFLEIVTSLASGLFGGIVEGVGRITTMLNDNRDTVAAGFSNLADVVQRLEPGLNALGGILGTLIAKLLEVTANVLASDEYARLFNSVAESVSGVVVGLDNWLSGLNRVEGASGFFVDIFGTIGGIAKALGDAKKQGDRFWETANNLNDKYWELGRTMRNGVVAAAMAYGDQIKTNVSFVDDLLSSSKLLSGPWERLSGIADTIRDRFVEVLKSVTGIGDRIKDIFRSTPGAGRGAGYQGAGSGTILGVTGNTGRSTGPHLDIRYASRFDPQRSRPTEEHLSRLLVDGQPLSNYRISSEHSSRNPGRAGHDGIDYATEVGLPITASVPIKKVDGPIWDPNGGGYYTSVEFEDGVVLNLLHLDPSSQTAGVGTGGASLASGGFANAFMGAAGRIAGGSQGLFSGGQQSLVARSIGLSEGTRDLGGGFTSAYYGHTDPGNGASNQGSFSAQQGFVSSEAADAYWLNKLENEYLPQFNRRAQEVGLEGNMEVLMNFLDLVVQAPAAAIGNGGFLDQLGRIAQQGASPNSILNARVQSYIDPRTGQFDAPGLGNTRAQITRDQQRRQSALTSGLNFNGQQGAQSLPDRQYNTVNGVEVEVNADLGGYTQAVESATQSAVATGVTAGEAEAVEEAERRAVELRPDKLAERALREARARIKQEGQLRGEARRQEDQEIQRDRQQRQAELQEQISGLDPEDRVGKLLLEYEERRLSIDETIGDRIRTAQRGIEDLEAAREIKIREQESLRLQTEAFERALLTGEGTSTTREELKKMGEAISAIDYSDAIAKQEAYRDSLQDLIPPQLGAARNNLLRQMDREIETAEELERATMALARQYSDPSPFERYRAELDNITVSFDKQREKIEESISALDQLLTVEGVDSDVTNENIGRRIALTDALDNLAIAQDRATESLRRNRRVANEDRQTENFSDRISSQLRLREAQARNIEQFDPNGATDIRRQSAQAELLLQMRNEGVALTRQEEEAQRELGRAIAENNRQYIEAQEAIGRGTPEELSATFAQMRDEASEFYRLEVESLAASFPTLAEQFRESITGSFSQGLTDGLVNIAQGGGFLESLGSIFDNVYNTILQRGAQNLSDTITGALFGNGDEGGFLDGLFGGDDDVSSKADQAATLLEEGGMLAGEQLLMAAERSRSILGGGTGGAAGQLSKIFGGSDGHGKDSRSIGTEIGQSFTDTFAQGAPNIFEQIFGTRGGGGILGAIADIFGGGGGGGIFSAIGSIFGLSGGGYVPNYAGGGIVEAMARERRESGRNPMVAVVHEGEYQIPAIAAEKLEREHGPDFMEGLRTGDISNYASGGFVDGIRPISPSYSMQKPQRQPSAAISLRLETVAIDGREYAEVSQINRQLRGMQAELSTKATAAEATEATIGAIRDYPEVKAIAQA